MNQYNVPILILLFNRLDTAQVVFNEIKKVRPTKLFIAADGPRVNVEGEKGRCEEAKTLVNQIDWPCEVKTLFQTKNLGMLHGPATAITWFFEHVEEGIILEHDCVPGQSFFPYVENLLEKYREDERIMHISGDNFQRGKVFGDGSYYFSKFNHAWGWASWRRAWKHFDTNMDTYPACKEINGMRSVWPEKEKAKVFEKIFNKIEAGKVIAWDYVWSYSLWMQGGLAILPNVNLVSNIGFGPLATHTTEKDSFMCMPAVELKEVIHPKFVVQCYDADNNSFKMIHRSNFLKKVKNRIILIMNKG